MNAKEMMHALEQNESRQKFSLLPMDLKVRNTCPGCGLKLIDDYTRAIEFVNGPPREGRCNKCGWCGTK